MTGVVTSEADVVVVGSLNVDRSVKVPRFPAPGETVLGDDLHVDNGGKGANQAVAAARLGARVAMVGAVGADADGAGLKEALTAEGIDTSAIVTSSRATGAAFITIDASGENSIVVAPGANGVLSQEDVENAASRIGEADVVMAQLEIPLPAVRAAREATRGLFLLNPAPASAISGSWLSTVDVLVPNRGELQALSGMAVTDDPATLTAAAATLGVGVVVVTLGSTGALVVARGSSELVPAREARVVDTTGAGDSFCGALAVALAGGSSPVEAARFATRCAAWTVGRRGAQASLPKLGDVA